MMADVFACQMLEVVIVAAVWQGITGTQVALVVFHAIVMLQDLSTKIAMQLDIVLVFLGEGSEALNAISACQDIMVSVMEGKLRHCCYFILNGILHDLPVGFHQQIQENPHIRTNKLRTLKLKFSVMRHLNKNFLLPENGSWYVSSTKQYIYEINLLKSTAKILIMRCCSSRQSNSHIIK